MSRTNRSPGLRRIASVVALASIGFASCGSDAANPNADATTPTPPDVSEEDPVSTDEPSDTIRPPEDTTPAETSPGSGAPVTSDPADEPSTTELTTTQPTTTQQALADAAVADVVERRGVDASTVVVVGVEEVTWPDGSLGCPQKGMQYQQVLTPGVRVIVEADGARAFYHGTSAGDLTYCAAPRPPVGA